MKSEEVMRGLIKVWADFETKLDQVPIIDKLNRGKFRLEDYKTLLINHRQQVIEGGRWIARAASSIDEHYAEHMEEFDEALKSGILDIENMGEQIIKTAKITARLYQLQLEEIDNV